MVDQVPDKYSFHTWMDKFLYACERMGMEGDYANTFLTDRREDVVSRFLKGETADDAAVDEFEKTLELGCWTSEVPTEAGWY